MGFDDKISSIVLSGIERCIRKKSLTKDTILMVEFLEKIKDLNERKTNFYFFYFLLMSQFKPSDSSVSKSQESTGPDTIQTVERVKAKKNGK